LPFPLPVDRIDRTKKRLNGVVAWLFVIFLAFGISALAQSSPGTSAETGIKVLENAVKGTFGEAITFELVVESPAVVDRVALYRQLEGEPVRARTEVDIELGERVDATHVWELEPGELRPGVRLEYYWIVTDRAGRRLEVPPRTWQYQDERFSWREQSQGDIHLYYYGDERERAQTILAEAVDAAERLQDDVGLDLVEDVAIYVYNSRRDMAPALSSRSSVFDERTLTLGVAMGKDTLLILGPHEDVRLTVAHEMSHIVVGLATDNPYTGLPRWLDEGLAMYAERALPRDNRRALERAIQNDTLISVRSLSGYVGDPRQVDLFYGQVYSLLEFMLDEYGQRKLLDLLATIKEGTLAEEALQQIYGFDLEELDARWRQSLGLEPRDLSNVSREAERASEPAGAPCAAGSIFGVALLGMIVYIRRQDLCPNCPK
jgi:hypothetical protein